MHTIHLKASKDSKEYEFKFNIHRCEGFEDLSLSAQHFYKEHGKKDLTFPHYEVEVLDHESLPAGTHCFPSGDGRGFICWPFRTPTKGDAFKLATGWSAAAFVTIETGEDANTVLGKFCSQEKQLRHLENAAQSIGVNIEILT